MKLIFSAVSLLVVLVVVGLLVRHQLHATTGNASPALAAAASQAGVALPASGSAPQRSQNIETQIQDAANKALQQGAARASEADQ